jgi:hypothetical protein
MARGKKTGGRKKGTPNKITAQTRQQIQEIINALLPDALNMIKAIDDPAKQLDAIAKLLPYILPKMSEVKVDAGDILNEVTITIKKPDDGA